MLYSIASTIEKFKQRKLDTNWDELLKYFHGTLASCVIFAISISSWSIADSIKPPSDSSLAMRDFSSETQERMHSIFSEFGKFENITLNSKAKEVLSHANNLLRELKLQLEQLNQPEEKALSTSSLTVTSSNQR